MLQFVASSCLSLVYQNFLSVGYFNLRVTGDLWTCPEVKFNICYFKVTVYPVGFPVLSVSVLRFSRLNYPNLFVIDICLLCLKLLLLTIVLSVELFVNLD